MPGGLGLPLPPPPPDFGGDQAPITLRQARRLLRLRRFELPELPQRRNSKGDLAPIAPKRPTKDAILQQAKDRQAFWQARNTEIDEDLDLYFMRNAPEVKLTGKGGEEVIHRVTPRAMVDKMANMAQRLKARVKATPRSDTRQYVDAAQMCEDACYEHYRQIDLQHQRRLLPGYAHDEAWYLAAMGWVASRHCLKPGADWPFEVELFDPRCCYPEPASEGVGQLSSMIFCDDTTKGSFCKSNPRFADDPAFRDLDEKDKVKVIWFEDEYWSVLIVNDGDPAYTAHKYGYCKWVMLPGGGTPLMDADSIGQHGAGVIRALRHILRYQNRLASQVASIIARDANPAVIVTTNKQLPGGQVIPVVDTRPGARTVLDAGAGQSVQPWESSLRPDLQQYMQGVVDEDIDNAGVPALMRGTMLAINSGFQFNVMKTNAEDVLQPMTKGLQAHREWTNRHLLLMCLVAERDGLLAPDTYAEEGNEQAGRAGVPLRVPNREAGADAYPVRGNGAAKYLWSVLDPEDVHVHGIEVEAIVSNMTPQDIAQMGQVASMLTQAGVMSEKRAFEDLLGQDDYEAEQTQIIYEQFMKQEQVVQEVTGPLSVRQKDPEVWAWYQRVQEQKQQQEQMMAQMQQMMAQMQGMQQQMAPPMGPPPDMGQPPMGPGGPPLPGLGLDSTVLPPQMQATTGMPGGGDPAAIEALLAATNGRPPGGY
jgi:hypothetical protein